jgi:CDP-diacylglycerol--glycerol-3-phosphate 3-phosphatidyltransferase
MVAVIVGREVAVSGLRSIAAAAGIIMKSSELGKTKMVLQVIAITVIILEGHRFQALHPLGKILLWTVVISAVISAAQYFWSFWKEWGKR